MKLFTIGYESADLSDFLATLVKAGVKRVVDIRDYPGSRRKGFSKNALAAHLHDSGMEYVHLKALGDPKEGRDAARRGDFSTFRRIYNARLLKEDAQTSLQELSELATDKASCLLCYERDPKDCHRTIVAIELNSTINCEIVHLGVVQGMGRELIAAE